MPNQTLDSEARRADIAEQWHSLMIRKTLVTSQWLCLNFGAPNASVRISELTEVTASLIYVAAVSILDVSCEYQLAIIDLECRGNRLFHRLNALNGAEDLLDYKTLDKIRDRRHALGHDSSNFCTIEELESALKVMGAQLMEWRILVKESVYELEAESSRRRDSEEPDVAFELDMIVRVLRDKKMTYEVCQTRKVFKLSKNSREV